MLYSKSKDTGVLLNYKLNPISNSRIGLNETYFSDKYSQYLCFSVFFSTNTLIRNDKSHFWSETQQKTHDYIQSLHQSGLGYRKIAKRLNEEGIKTFKSKTWGSNYVHSVLKRNKEKLQREEIGKQESEIEFGKMELVWLREGELWKNPRKELVFDI